MNNHSPGMNKHSPHTAKFPNPSDRPQDRPRHDRNARPKIPAEEWRAHLDENFVVGAVLTDPSKTFDCIAHDPPIANPAAYGPSDTALRYTHSYLSNQKQYLRINNTHSSYQKIISGVPQGSILEPIYFNLSINDLLFFVSNVSFHNFADDYT